MTLLTVKDLCIEFRSHNSSFLAVDGLNFSIEDGRVLGIVGESGAGKSVLSLALLGLLSCPSANIVKGHVFYRNQDLLSLSERALRRIRGNKISMIFQDPSTSLNPHVKIGYQIMEALLQHQILSKKVALKKVIQSLEEVGIEPAEQKMHCYPFELSGGMRQRVMIAMALINKPDILIADEPTTALDVTVQAQILALIKKLQREYGLAVIFISHDMAVISEMADDVLVMEKGMRIELGEASYVLNDPRDEYTQSLMTTIPTQAKKHSKVFAIEDENCLTVSNLCCQFSTGKGFFRKSQGFPVNAVSNVSFNLKKGEILGLVGESGSGKSTLARCIMRLVKGDAGLINLNGVELTALSGEALRRARPNFQMVFQDPYSSLNPRMTVYETLAEPIKKSLHWNNEDLDLPIYELMEEVGLDSGLLSRYPHELSGGQRQRVAIARALAMKPQLLIADEPVSSLDLTNRTQILELLVSLTQKYQLSMVFISHDLSVVRYISDRVLVMHHGRIVESGPVESVFGAPEHPYTQLLISSILTPIDMLANNSKL